MIGDLERCEVIRAHRTGRVNVYVPIYSVTSLIAAAAEVLPKAISNNYIVIPSLAEKIGLKAAIVLQQIHIRIHKEDGSTYFIRSLEQWHSETFPFWGAATIKRIFVFLRKLNLIVVKPYRREDDGVVNSYRVNYIGVAELLGLPVPNVENPYEQDPKNANDKSWQNWTNPVTLLKHGDVQ